MSTPAIVDFRDVIKAFNQTGYFPFKLDPNKATFGNVKLDLAKIQWSNNTFDAASYPGYSRRVEIKTQNPLTVTSVSASPDAHPGSKLTITTGYVDGFGTPKVDATIAMPSEFGRVTMRIDLTKTVQDVKLSKAEGTSPETLIMRGRGNASVGSNNTVYQGSFEAVACLKGPVVIQSQDGPPFQGSIEELAQTAAKEMRKPFYFDANSPHGKALCWKVTGFADLLLENINVVRGQ